MKCEKCQFWEHGLCHRNPPTLPSSEDSTREFPATYPDDWCGEFKAQAQPHPFKPEPNDKEATETVRDLLS